MNRTKNISVWGVDGDPGGDLSKDGAIFLQCKVDESIVGGSTVISTRVNKYLEVLQFLII